MRARAVDAAPSIARLVTLGLSVLVLVWMSGTESVAQSAAPEQFDPATAQAWIAARADTGWLAPDQRPAFALNENWVYTQDKPSAPARFPHFGSIP